MIHVPPSAFGSSSHLHLVGWQSRRDRAGRTGCPPRRDNRTGKGQERSGKESRAEKSRNINGSVYPVSVSLGGTRDRALRDTSQVLCLPGAT